MAYLSSYLGGGTSSPGRRQTQGSYYPAPKPYQPYTVPRRGVSGIEQASSPYQGQDLASALLYQKQASQSALPSNQFDQSYDYDPILSKIQALSSQSVANAQTDAAQLRKQALIASGATSVGKSLGIDADTLAAAGQNPESEMSVLQRQFADRQQQLIEAMSAQNLLYSGEYARQLDLLGQGRASAEAGIGSRLRDMLSGIDAGVLNSQEAARQAELEARQQLILQAQYAGHPIWDPTTNSYVGPHSTDTGTGGGGPTWFDMNGNPRNDPIPDGWVIHGGAGTDFSPYMYGPPVSPGSTVQPVAPPPPPPPDSGVINPIDYYLGGGLGIG